MADPINVDDLRFLLAVGETGSTLAASRMLGVSQSTVSRRIAALEAAINVVLFDKRRTGYALTEAGSVLLGPADTVRRAVDGFSTAVSSLGREASGSVRFTTNEVLATFVLPHLIERLKQSHPGVRLEVDTSNILRDLATGEADVALRAAPAPTHPNLVGVKLFEDYWSLYCSRSYSEQHGFPRSVDELAGHALIGIDSHVRGRAILDWVRAHFPADRTLLRHNSVPAVFSSVRNGVGVGLCSEFVGSRDPELILCFRPPVPPAAEVWLVTHERLRQLPRIRAVMDTTRSLIRDMMSSQLAR